MAFSKYMEDNNELILERWRMKGDFSRMILEGYPDVSYYGQMDRDPLQ